MAVSGANQDDKGAARPGLPGVVYSLSVCNSNPRARALVRADQVERRHTVMEKQCDLDQKRGSLYGLTLGLWVGHSRRTQASPNSCEPVDFMLIAPPPRRSRRELRARGRSRSGCCRGGS